MTREQKIEALAEAFDMFEIGYANEEELSKESFKAGILAGIALRDAELLELLGTFNIAANYQLAWKKAREFHVIAENETVWVSGFSHGDQYKHEQFMKILKEDG